MQSSRKYLIIALAILLGAVGFWYFTSAPDSEVAQDPRQPLQAPATTASQPERGRTRLAADPSEAAARSQQDRSALKRQGAETAPIRVSVVELKSRQPVAGALVSIYLEQGSKALDETFADEQGKGSFEASGGRYRLEAVQQGYQKGKAVFAHEPGKDPSHQTVFLSTAYYLRGTVKDEQGQIIPRAEVTLKRRDQPEIVLESDENGYFEITLPPATYRVEVRKDSYTPKVKPFILVGPRNVPVLDIVLTRP